MKDKKLLTTNILAKQMGAVSILMSGLGAALGCTSSIGDGNGATPPPGLGAGAGAANPAGAGGGSSGGGTGASSGGSSVAPATAPGRVVIRRLNIVEYNNTVRDLLDTTQGLPDAFPADYTAFGFDNVASALTLTDVTLGLFFETAQRIATDVLANHRAKALSCDLAVEKETCVGTALNALLPRAWRRPVEPSDVEPLVALYTAVKADGNGEDQAFGRVLQAVLMAPEFIYRVEHNSGIAGVRDLNGYELASRLSYFIWSTMPDEALTAAAASGALKDTAGLTGELKRLLSSVRAAAFTENFGSQWLPVRALEGAKPSPTVYRQFDEGLRAAMAAETMLLFADIAKGSRPLTDLFTSTSGYVNDRLAKHYGMTPVGSDTPRFTPLPANRMGLLTQGSFLTAVAFPEDSHPVKRGKWLLANVLCKEPPLPTFEIPEVPERMDGMSRKQQLAAHQTQPICAACHSLMDPLGLALEQYDGVGAFRTEDRGVVIEPSGVFKGDSGDVPFAGPAELSQLIAKAPSVSRCVAEHVFAYGVGRGVRSGDEFDSFILEQMGKSFQESGQLFPRLIEAMVTSDVFRKREDEANAP